MITLSTGTVYYTEKEYDDLQYTNRKLRTDIETIDKALRDEAESRDWCIDYNKFVEKVNEELMVSELKRLLNDYEVEIILTRTESATVTIKVQGMNEEHAKESFDYLDYWDIESQYEAEEGSIYWESDDNETYEIYKIRKQEV
jgi:hypothetical protein